MVEKKIHHYFQYDSDSRSLTDRIQARKEKALAIAEDDDMGTSKKEKEDENTLTRGYLSRCIEPETTRSSSAINQENYVAIMWNDLLVGYKPMCKPLTKFINKL